jgi:nucleoside-diphosphate-sugar epimerase
MSDDTVTKMAQAAKKRLVVAGGNGFLGSRICKSAVARGWEVTSIRQETFSYLRLLLTKDKSHRGAYMVKRQLVE